MKSIEELVSLFGTIPAADWSRWSVETLVADRLHLSRGECGEFAVFLEGPLASFGEIPPWGGAVHSDTVTALPSGRRIAALRVSSQDPIHGNRVIAHIAYELGRRLESTSSVNNNELLDAVSWILPLLGDQDTILEPERQYGLVGECVLLHRLLGIAVRLGMPGREVLRRWKGAGGSKRDFAAKDIAIEVKTTSHATRLHYFNSIEQLDPQSLSEEVFLFSLGMRLDASAPKKLPDFIAEVESGLLTAAGARDDEAIQEFRRQLLQSGYQGSLESVYRSQPGFGPPHLPPVLYREGDLDRVRISSFRDGRLPSMVVRVGYALEVGGPGLSNEEADAVLERLLNATSLGHGA